MVDTTVKLGADWRAVWKQYSAPALFAGGVLAVVLDLRYPDAVAIGWPTVALLTLLVSLPHLHEIRQTVGLFAVSSRHEDTSRIEQPADSIPKQSVSIAPAVDTFQESINELPALDGGQTTAHRRERAATRLHVALEESPEYAVAALWLETERAIRELAEGSLDAETGIEHIPFMDVMGELPRADPIVFTEELCHVVMNLQELRNDALGDATVNRETATETIELGSQLLEYLYYYTESPDELDTSAAESNLN